MIQKYLLFVFAILMINHSVIAQFPKLSNFSEISVITYGPGDVLYEKFGHTALRIKDPVLQFDLIYNYGIFDLDEDNFYVNFTKGYMKYKLMRYAFPSSLRAYNRDQRWVKEQILQLTHAQKNAFFHTLEVNAAPKNASYFYDPFFNNCSTKPRDIIEKVLGDNLRMQSDFISEHLTIRELMNREINPNTWGSLGINIALGNRLDEKATAAEYLYLPDYVYKALENATVEINGEQKPLVKKTNLLLDYPEKIPQSDTPSPSLVFFLILLLGIWISFRSYKRKNWYKWFDILLFFITGTFGILIVFLWFFTNHSTAPFNFNFLWAFAPNFILAGILCRNSIPQWTRFYILFILLLLCLIPFVWVFGMQSFPNSLLSLFLLLLLRYVAILKLIKNYE